MFSADTQCAWWLQWFTMDSDTHAANRWFLLADGRKCATNGSIAVVTKDESDQVPGPVTEDRIGMRIKSMGEVVTKMLAMPAEKRISLPHADAVRMFGPCEHITTATCATCNGKKQVPHYCSCDLCDAETEDCDRCNAEGFMDTFPEIRYATLWNRAFDANKIAYILAHAPETIAVDIELVKVKDGTGADYVVRISTARWQAVLVQMEERIKREHDCPELIQEVAA